jgi:5'-3' exoribonuclease 1
MGIPTYFKSLLEDNNNIITIVEKKSIDFFFLDFNAIIYTVFANTKFTSEEELLDNIIIELKKMCNLVKPKKAMYIAVDGTAPKAKMVQQRSRRYKSLQLEYYKQTMLSQEEKKMKTFKNSWNPANNICPGTDFMIQLNARLLRAMKNKIFNVPKVILNGVTTPGEGEHKILPHIRKLKDTDDSIVIFSPDNDILSLSLLTQKNNIYIIRYMDIYSFNILAKSKSFNYHYDSNTNMYYLPKIYISIDNIKLEFRKKFNQEDEINTIIDYNFLLEMVGNDFVPSLPYMKIRNGGLGNLIRIYKNVRKNNEYLVDKTSLKVNLSFFIDIVKNLSNMEDSEMKKLQSTIIRERNQPIDKDDNIMNNLEHCYMFNSYHPLNYIY